jgi:hypothetical protein
MLGAKPWQIAVVVLCLAGAGVATWLSMFGGEQGEFASSITLADVQTGELFEVDLGKKSLMLPMTRPGQKEPTLYPVMQVDGKWLIEVRYRDVRGEVLKNSKVYDAKTGEVTVSGPAKELDP